MEDQKIVIKKEPGEEVNKLPDVIFTHIFYIHFKHRRGAAQYPPLNIPGWTYQDRNHGVHHSIATTYRSDTPVTVPVAMIAYNQVKAIPHVRRVLLMAYFRDWTIEDDEDDISAFAAYLHRMSLNPNDEDEPDQDSSDENDS